MRKIFHALFVVITISVLLYGCGGAKEVKMGDVTAPEWVVKGSGAFAEERGKVFYGVASAYGIRNFSLLRTTADNRARNEVAKIFQFYTSSLMKDYMASTTAGDPYETSEEQHVELAIKTVTSMTLSGVEIIDHWQHPETGEFFSLARLDLQSFQDNLSKAKELNERARDYIRQNADRLHDELEEEEAKMRGE